MIFRILFPFVFILGENYVLFKNYFDINFASSIFVGQKLFASNGVGEFAT